MRTTLQTLAICLSAGSCHACETALLLAIDISGSIDAGEYALQQQGLADALADPEVAELLVRDQVALAVVQWSGVDAQALVMPWRRMLSADAVAGFSNGARSLPRAFQASDTAVGQAISFAAAQFDQVTDCRRHVIDISGDGPENAGFTVGEARTEAQRNGITINAIAIEDMGPSTPIAAFYRRWVVTRGGFVMGVHGLQDYPVTLRAKLLRELARVSG